MTTLAWTPILTSRQSTEKSANEFLWAHILESKEDLWVSIQWINISEFISDGIARIGISDLNLVVSIVEIFCEFFEILLNFEMTYSKWTMFDSVMHKFWIWVIGKCTSVIIWFVGGFKGLDSRELNNSCCWSICPWPTEFVLDKVTTPGHGFCELSSVTLFIGQISSNKVKNDMKK